MRGRTERLTRSPTDLNEVQRLTRSPTDPTKIIGFKQNFIPSNIKKTFVCDKKSPGEAHEGS